MTTISAKVIADSVANDIRLTTLQLRYPRFIHAEFMTHRVFSRNARSSRAVPLDRMIQEIIDDPVVPLFWGKNQKGMQASEEHNALSFLRVPDTLELPSLNGLKTDVWRERILSREDAWLAARDRAVEAAQAFANAGYHKQVVNRLLEPFMHIDVLVTATEWSNFFALRNDPAAEPHMQVLARAMKAAMDDHRPKKLGFDDWHLPYIKSADRDLMLGQTYLEATEQLIKISVARCARISYTPFDGDARIESELRRYNDLVGATPIHASPAEHQATPDVFNDIGFWERPEQWGNLRGWRQYRKMFPNECL